MNSRNLSFLIARARLAVFGFVVILAAPWVAAAELSAETKAAVDAAVEAFMKKAKAPGLSAAIAVDGEVCYEHGYGLADVENNVPATAETIYRLASISKMLTATAVMQLVEQGKLDLEAPIQNYVPGFPEKQAPITCELLLKHQSGIRHYKGDEVRSNVAYAHVADAFRVFKDDPLLFTPGEKYSYTTYGFCVLGAAIEGASGQNYVSYLDEHIFRPSGMKTIQADRVHNIIPHRAAGYRRSGPLLVNDIQVDVSNKIPGGGWCATPGDLARFAVALSQGKLVSSETLERMWTPQKTSKGAETPVGYGCFMRTIDGDRRIDHGGGQPKVSTFLTFSPAQKTAVAVMCNLRNAPVEALADELLKIVREPSTAR
ncbi:MAG: serine hydrolase domain-containing protein [Pirellulales bacterium]